MSTPAEPVALDLDSCAREPIHIPGAIQPHGLLIAVREPDLVCTQISANAGALLGRAIPLPVGQDLGGTISPAFQTRIRSALAAGDPQQVSPLPVEIDDRAFDAGLHRHDGALIIELEPVAHPADPASATRPICPRCSRSSPGPSPT